LRDYKKGLKSNIWKYFIFEALWSLIFFLPIFQLFYLVRKMTITQIAFIGIAFTVALMVLEIPSGILADQWGRKKTLFLSQMFFVIGMILIIFSNSFWLFVVSSVFSGFWIASYSGTGVSFYYDTLKELKREHDYEKLWGKLSLTTSLISFVAAFTAGFLFEISDILPYFLSVISGFFSMFVILTFTEPKIHKKAEQDNIVFHFKKSLFVVTQNENINFIVFFGAVIAFALNYLFNYGQIYLKTISVPVVFFGMIFAMKSIAEGIGASSAANVKNKFGYRSILTFSLFFTVAVIFGLSLINSFVGVIVFLTSFFIIGMVRIVQRGYIHQKIESQYRATVDSVSSFVMAIITIIFEPIAGLIAELYSIQTSFAVLGCILVVYTI
jgi:MFS family permease